MTRHCNRTCSVNYKEQQSKAKLLVKNALSIPGGRRGCKDEACGEMQISQIFRLTMNGNPTCAVVPLRSGTWNVAAVGGLRKRVGGGCIESSTGCGNHRHFLRPASCTQGHTVCGPRGAIKPRGGSEVTFSEHKFQRARGSYAHETGWKLKQPPPAPPPAPLQPTEVKEEGGGWVSGLVGGGN